MDSVTIETQLNGFRLELGHALGLLEERNPRMQDRISIRYTVKALENRIELLNEATKAVRKLVHVETELAEAREELAAARQALRA